eukprot:CAMPEP_0184488216 /NCGR_PEP_ID=MMETSP0113_2-20130426/10598_1 /TAXON_ID=91329 /ORGANISM="Norrisiella sphaerica, Strain BC52" /LENGTH=482 /DNA_ID=CAMNT_0026870721 /DNA_START=224 /DNA_END=1672 /DNA_ORIENTATION=+
MGFMTDSGSERTPKRRGRKSQQTSTITDEIRRNPSLIKTVYNMIPDERIKGLESKLSSKLGASGAKYYLPEALETEKRLLDKPMGERNRRIMIAASNKKRKILSAIGEDLPMKEKRKDARHASKKATSEMQQAARQRLLNGKKVVARDYVDPVADTEERRLYKHEQKAMKDKIFKELRESLFSGEISEKQLQRLETLVEQRKVTDEGLVKLQSIEEEAKKLIIEMERSREPFSYLHSHYLRETIDETKEYLKLLTRLSTRIPDSQSLISLVRDWRADTHKAIQAESVSRSENMEESLPTREAITNPLLIQQTAKPGFFKDYKPTKTLKNTSFKPAKTLKNTKDTSKPKRKRKKRQTKEIKEDRKDINKPLIIQAGQFAPESARRDLNDPVAFVNPIETLPLENVQTHRIQLSKSSTQMSGGESIPQVSQTRDKGKALFADLNQEQIQSALESSMGNDADDYLVMISEALLQEMEHEPVKQYA